MQYELARRDFRTWLGYVWILDPPPDGRGHTQFEIWPYMDEAIPLLCQNRLVTWLKARQIGASWLLAAYALWVAQYQYGAKVVLISQGQEEAKKLLAKCRYIWVALPDALKRPMTLDNREMMCWGDNQIEALPSTPKAGRSSNNTLVIMDEADYHDYLSDDYYGIKPTIDGNGGQLILVSTKNPMSMSSLFTTLYMGAPDNGFRAIFFPWGARPGRDADWLARKAKEYPDRWLFEKEYPETAQQALAPARSMLAFDLDALREMEGGVVMPVRTIGVARMFALPQVGHRYTAGSDTSHGVGGDYSVTTVIDCTTGRGVADVYSNVMAPDEFTALSVDLLKRYGTPIWGIEDNDWGILVVKRAQELGYGRLFYRKEGQAGYHTGANRSELWGGLQEGVRDRAVAPLAAEGVGQFWKLIRNPNKGGRIEALEGANDDYPMAMAIAWQLRHQATRLTAKEPGQRAMVAAGDYKW